MERLTVKVGNDYEIRMSDLSHIVRRFGEYEDLEEQGLLLRLPCKKGTKHNKLTFLCDDETTTKIKHRAYIICECECGNLVRVRKDNWESGSTKGCGCLYQTHGHAIGKHDRIYNIYHGMKKRCFNPNCKNYDDYGGRGITVCDEWSNDFMSFYEWSISNGYNDKLTIDRIDVNGNYEPDNCRWVTMEAQHKNTRKIQPVMIVETGDIFLSIADCARYINGTGGNISSCLSGKIPSYKRMHYKKISKEEAEQALLKMKAGD